MKIDLKKLMVERGKSKLWRTSRNTLLKSLRIYRGLQLLHRI